MKIIELNEKEQFPKLETYTRGDGALLVKLDKKWHLATKVEFRKFNYIGYCHCGLYSLGGWCDRCGYQLFESKTALELID